MKPLNKTVCLCVISSFLLPTVFTGCGSPEKVIAIVGDHSIKEKELFEKAVEIRAAEIPLDMDAGGTALTALIREHLLEECAKSKGLSVSDDQVKRLRSYQDQFDLQTSVRMQRSGQTPESLDRSIRTSLIEFSIGTENAKADAKEVESEYNTFKSQPTGLPTPADPTGLVANPVRRPEIITVKILPVPNKDVGLRVIEMLKKDGDFKKVARALNPDPSAVANTGNETPVSREALKQQAPALEAAFSKLSEGQFTSEPISQNVRSRTNANQMESVYFVGQLVKKYPAKDFSMEDARIALEFRVLAKKNAEWQTHKDQELSKFTQQLYKDNKIQILAAKYQTSVGNFVKSMVASKAATGPTGTMGSGGGAPAPTPAPNTQPAPSAGGKP